MGSNPWSSFIFLVFFNFTAPLCVFYQCLSTTFTDSVDEKSPLGRYRSVQYPLEKLMESTQTLDLKECLLISDKINSSVIIANHVDSKIPLFNVSTFAGGKKTAMDHPSPRLHHNGHKSMQSSTKLTALALLRPSDLGKHLGICLAHRSRERSETHLSRLFYSL